MKKILFSLLLLLSACLLIIFPDTASNAVNASLKTAVGSVLPALFPFMVLSDMIISSEIISGKSRFFHPLNKLFNLTGKGTAVMILGNLCGFPVGARLAAKQYKEGLISSSEAVRVTALSNNVSTAFAVSFVGGELFSSRTLGIIIYVCQLAAALFIGAASGAFADKTKKQIKIHNEKNMKKPAADIFISAVSDSALSSIGIISYIVIFGVISAYAKMFFVEFLSLSPVFYAAAAAVLEISNGCIASHTMGYPVSYLLCAFAIGFSGISVICQSSMFLRREKIPTAPFAALKAAQGILCALFTYAAVKFANINADISVLKLRAPKLSPSFFIICIIILSAYLLFLIKKILKRKNTRHKLNIL